MKDWICIYTTGKPQDAEIVKGLLTFNEINSVIINKQDSSYLFGEFEVYVSSADEEKAKSVLSENNELS